MNSQKQEKLSSHERAKSTQKTSSKKIGVKVARKLYARRHPDQKIWFGLGMMGLIGWSVALPTLLGAGLGVYFDAHFQSDRSFTLAFLAAGLAIGCFNAWHWIVKEDKEIHAPEANTDTPAQTEEIVKQAIVNKDEHEKKVNKNALGDQKEDNNNG